MTKPTCTYDADHGWLDGDRPCSADHCGIRGCAYHVDHDAGIWTCPRCIGRVRSDLATIVRLYRQELPRQAEAVGINSEAANLIGPASLAEDAETMRGRVDAERGWCSWPMTDQRHPYTVLGRLDMALREIYGPRTSLAVTVERAARYLDDLLAGPFPHEDQFDDTAAEIAQLRAHMETAAGDSRKPELGAPCPTCAANIEAEQAARLAESALGATNGGGMGPNATSVIPGAPRARSAPRLRKRYADGIDERTVAGERDTWHCPDNPEHWWPDADYRLTVEAAQRERVKGGRWLTAAEVAEQYAVKPATLRKWASRDQVKTRWIVEQLRYDTDDVSKMLDGAHVAL